jgi:hypothetical protein
MSELEDLAKVMGSVPKDPAKDYLGPAWRMEYEGRWRTTVKPGMEAVITFIELNGVYELGIVGKTTSDRVGLYDSKLSAARQLFVMIKNALDDCEKMRGELWDFVMKHEGSLLR